MNRAPRSKSRLLFAGLKLVIISLVAWGISHTVRAALADLDRYAWSLQPWWLVPAGVSYLLGLLPSAIFWHRILLALGQRPRLLASLRAYYIGHLGKYVPGKALVVIMRAGLIKGARVDATVAAVSVFLETLTMMAVGAGLAAGILILLFPQQRLLVGLAVAVMVASGLPTLPPVFRRLTRKIVAKNHDAARVPLDGVSFRLMAAGWLAVAGGWVVTGLSLWATLRALGVEAQLPGRLPLLVASVSLAMVLGFLSLIPGGAGVREWVLATTMKPAFGSVNAVLSAIVLRLVWLLSELLISCILYVSGPPAASAAVSDQARSEPQDGS